MAVNSESNAATWTDRQALAEQLLPLIGSLYRDKGVVLSIHGRPLVNSAPLAIVKAHRFARHVDGSELDLNETLAAVQAIAALNPGQASIDLGALLADQRASGATIADHVNTVLSSIAGQGKPASADDSVDVVLYGFGRIGRLLARILLSQAE
ncbi:MAG: hypothetical protein RIR88_880, partial [Actinomycetota bacterium]